MKRDHRASGVLYRNDWLHDWLIENGIADAGAAYEAAQDKRRLDDLVNRAEAQKEEPATAPGGRSLIAGRSLDLTPYLACDHPSCVARQVDDLFSRVWHYFDKIAIVGPDKHGLLEAVYSGNFNTEQLAVMVANKAFPIFHVRDIGADDLVTWISKPPPCLQHWPEYGTLEAFQIPAKGARAIASQLLAEGKVTLEKADTKSPKLRLSHRDLYGGFYEVEVEDVQSFKGKKEPLEHALARYVVGVHWLGTASDIYSAHSIDLPLGLGIGLEATLARLQGDPIFPAEVAFNLDLPVLDGLPLRELLALRQSESDAFVKFQDSLTRAIKEGIKSASPSEDANDIASEIRADVIDPALHEIRQRLTAAKGVLQKTHRYNIALAGLSTMCGFVGAPVSLATGFGIAATVGAVAVESKLISEKRDVALSDMYFLWRATEYARGGQDKTRPSRNRSKRS